MEIQWGIIGCGAVTEMKSGPAFQKVPRSKLVAVMRRNAGKARDYAQRHQVSKWYDDARHLINDPDVHAVYVATPPDTHAEYAIRVMESGKPVYVEKPMARNYKECLDMIEASRNTGMPLFVAYYRRSLPGFLKVRSMIEAGVIGAVRHVQVRLYKSFMAGDLDPHNLQWRVIPEIAGAGHFFDLASHQMDYLDFLFGPVVDIQSMALNQGGAYPAEDIVLANFRFENGIPGSGTWCFTVDPAAEEDALEFIGEKGRIEFSTFDPIPIKIVTSKGVEEVGYENPEHIQYHLIDSIVKELNGEGHCPSTGITASRTSRVLDQMVAAFYEPKKNLE